MADLNVDLIKNNNNYSTTNSYNSTSKSNIQNSIFDEASASTFSVAGEGGM